jgi:chromosome segregation ATPase
MDEHEHEAKLRELQEQYEANLTQLKRDYEDRVNHSIREKEQFKVRIEALEAKCEEAEATKIAYERDLEEMDTIREEKKELEENLMSLHEDLEAQLMHSNHKTEELQTQYKELVTKHQYEMGDIRQNYEDQLTDLSTQNEELKVRIGELQEEHANKMEHSQQYNTEVVELKGQIKAYKSMIDDLHDRLGNSKE